MKNIKVEAFAIKMRPNETSADNQNIDQYGDYYIAIDAWPSIYSRAHETCLVRLETDDGLVIATHYPEPVNGVFQLDEFPGLGVEIDEHMVLNLLFKPTTSLHKSGEWSLQSPVRGR